MATVAPASITPPGIGIRLSGAEVGGRQERGHCVASGERFYVVVIEVRAVINRSASGVDRQLHTRAGTELVAVKAEAEARITSGFEHGTTLIGIECAGFAKGVNPLGVRGRTFEHLAANEIDVVVGPPLELVGQQMGSHECCVVG